MVRCASSGFNSITLVNYSLVKENYNALIQRGRKDFTYIRPGELNHKSQAVQVLGYSRENLTPRYSPVTQPQRLNLPDVSTGLGSWSHASLQTYTVGSHPSKHVDQEHALQGPLLSAEDIPLPVLPRIWPGSTAHVLLAAEQSRTEYLPGQVSWPGAVSLLAEQK